MIRRVSCNEALIIERNPLNSLRASSTSRSINRSQISARRIRLVSAWVGPSWIWREMRTRSSSCASMMPITSDVFVTALISKQRGRLTPRLRGVGVVLRGALQRQKIDQKASLLLIFLDVLLAALELLGLRPQHKEAQLRLMRGVVEIANVLARIVLQMELHVAKPVRKLQLAGGMPFDLAIGLAQQQRDFGQRLRRLFETLAGFGPQAKAGGRRILWFAAEEAPWFAMLRSR